jgi:hypothetical protein
MQRLPKYLQKRGESLAQICLSRSPNPYNLM